MSTIISWMKFIFFIFLVKLNDGQDSIMVSNCQSNSDEYCYLTEAIDLILFGNKNNQSDIDKFLDMLNDNDTLDSVLQLGVLQLYRFAQNNPELMPSEREEDG